MKELQESVRRVLGRCHAYLSVLPGMFVILLWAYATYTWVLIGHWPYYGHPDPKNISLHGVHTIVGASFPLSLLAVVVWVATVGLFAVTTQRHTFKRNAALFMVAIAILATQVFMDPGGLFEWFCD